MSHLKFLRFDEVGLDRLLEVVNDASVRTHLIDHPAFDAGTLRQWMDEKIQIDSQPGCRTRAVIIDDTLAGWCGIQPDDQGFELAIVISKPFWGHGIGLFRTLMAWAAEMGHHEVLFHLLESRPDYKALTKMASRVLSTEQLGRRFTTYFMAVDPLFPHQ